MLANSERKPSFTPPGQPSGASVMDERQHTLERWLQQQLPATDFSLTPLPADASFRRYFRVQQKDQTWIAMDAPPTQEDCQPFFTLSQLFRQHGLEVPEIFHSDLKQGFLLLTDFGEQVYFRILNNENANLLYNHAIDNLLHLQTYPRSDGYAFPAFTPLLIQELKLFQEWYLQKHLQLQLTSEDENCIAETFNRLLQSALQQPQVCVHRDYHSRNLMHLANNRVGILDFQDAVWGPITYDLVSLLRDCYIAWPKVRVSQWLQQYHQQAREQKILLPVSLDEFQRWFDWMGMQRHLKALFIFARKWHRDQNPNYLPEMPRTLNYVMEISGQYPEFKQFHHFLQTRVNK